MGSELEINLGIICMRLEKLIKEVNMDGKQRKEGFQGGSHHGATVLSPGKS